MVICFLFMWLRISSGLLLILVIIICVWGEGSICDMCS